MARTTHVRLAAAAAAVATMLLGACDAGGTAAQPRASRAATERTADTGALPGAAPSEPAPTRPAATEPAPSTASLEPEPAAPAPTTASVEPAPSTTSDGPVPAEPAATAEPTSPATSPAPTGTDRPSAPATAGVARMDRLVRAWGARGAAADLGTLASPSVQEILTAEGTGGPGWTRVASEPLHNGDRARYEEAGTGKTLTLEGTRDKVVRATFGHPSAGALPVGVAAYGDALATALSKDDAATLRQLLAPDSRDQVDSPQVKAARQRTWVRNGYGWDSAINNPAADGAARGPRYFLQLQQRGGLGSITVAIDRDLAGRGAPGAVAGLDDVQLD